VDLPKMEELERKLLAVIDLQQDCLRMYRMPDS
jgi:hypothetical protein